MLENSPSVAKNTNSLLEKEVDDFLQYQQRACIIVDRMKPVDGETEEQIKEKVSNVLVKNLGFDEERVDSKINKCHRLGKPKSEKQSTIIRFKTHCFRAAVYEMEKITKNRKLKVKISLTKKHTKTLTHAYKMVESNQHIKLAFADVNGNLKLRLTEPLERNKYTYTIHSIEDLEDICNKFGWDIPELDNKE